MTERRLSGTRNEQSVIGSHGRGHRRDRPRPPDDVRVLHVIAMREWSYSGDHDAEPEQYERFHNVCIINCDTVCHQNR